MSTPDDRPGVEAGELLDENGNIDLGAVKSITNTAAAGRERVTRETCSEIRRRVRNGESGEAVADDLNHGGSAVRRHAKGECHHLESQITEPPLRFDAETQTWVVRGE